MVLSKSLQLLTELGFSANEGKAYLALLACQPGTGYEIAREAGLPTSKIYEVLAKLTARHVVQAVESEGQTQRYMALPPDDFLSQVREGTRTRTEQLAPLLASVGESGGEEIIWPLSDSDQVLGKCRALIDRATATMLLSLWPEELAALEESLRAAENRGVRIALVHFGEPGVQVGATYHHPVERTLYEEKGGRGLTLVVDGHSVVIGHFGAGGDVEGAWSRNRAFVTVAEDYVKHDVYITKVTRFLNPELTERFGTDYARLRDVFNADA